MIVWKGWFSLETLLTRFQWPGHGIPEGEMDDVATFDDLNGT